MQRFLIFASLVLLGCNHPTSPKASPAESSPGGSGKSRTIVAGVGVEGCKLGDAKQAAIKEFGPAYTEEDGYLLFPESGVELAMTPDMKVRCLFFHFQRGKNDAPTFAGKTDRGIDRNSKEADVLRIYGKPNRVGESTISEFGSRPGAREKRLEYDNIDFTFWDGALANIDVCAPLKK